MKQLKKRGTHRRKRERKPLPGMMLHQDGSTHEWVEGHVFYSKKMGLLGAFIGLKQQQE